MTSNNQDRMNKISSKQRVWWRDIMTNGVFVLVIMSILGFLFYVGLSAFGDLQRENQAVKNQLSEFVNGDRVIVFEDKTFVRYDQRPISATIYSSGTCSLCMTETQEIITKLQALLPTLGDLEVLDTDNSEVRDAALRSGIGYLPGVVFSENVTETAFYKRGAEFFNVKSDGSVQLFTHALGQKPTNFIATTIGLKGFSSNTADPVGNVSAPIEIHAFLTADCPACKTTHDVLKIVEKSNSNVRVIEHFAENLQRTDTVATQAIACAHQSGKGKAFTNTLFARQAAWLPVDDLDAVFTRYATNVGIPTATFSSCLEEENLEIYKQNRLFQTFGITEVPTIFIDNVPYVGVQTVADLNKAITDIDSPQ